jgi:hypothetical protein
MSFCRNPSASSLHTGKRHNRSAVNIQPSKEKTKGKGRALFEHSDEEVYVKDK